MKNSSHFFGVLALVFALGPLSAAAVELQLVRFDDPAVTVDKLEQERPVLNPISTPSGVEMKKIGIDYTGWARNVLLDGKPIFERYYEGRYIDRLPVARVDLSPGEHAIWPGNPDSQFQHRRRHMLEIGDQLERHPVIKQERRCGTRLSMMQRWHRIEEVGCNTRSGINCLLDDHRIRTGVPNRHDCSRSDELWDRGESATNLGRQRHHRDLAAGKQLGQLIVGDTTENVGIVCTTVVRRQPWPFKVDTRQRAVGGERKQRLNLSQ